MYGQRFGGIEPHFKDYKSAAFEVPRSHIRDAEALGRLLMLLAAATLVALSFAIHVMAQDALKTIDWHTHRGLSFLQIGLRLYQSALLPKTTPTPVSNVATRKSSSCLCLPQETRNYEDLN